MVAVEEEEEEDQEEEDQENEQFNGSCFCVTVYKIRY